MTAKSQVKAGVATHFPNADKVSVEQGDSKLNNSQKAQMLMDPEDLEGGRTHSEKDPQFKGDKKAPTTASVKTPVKAGGPGAQSGISDKELPKGGKIAEIDNDVDPSKGYLDQTAGMPVINNASVDDGLDEVSDEDEFSGEEDEFAPEEGVGEAEEVASEFGEEEDDEFSALPEIKAGEDEILDGGGEDEFDDLEPLAVEDDHLSETLGDLGGGGTNEAPYLEIAGEDEAIEAPPSVDEVPLVDVDQVPEDDEVPVAFASIGASLHVIRANRIIASMTKAVATKAGCADVYMMDQFQDVVAHSIDTKGLRKGLVQSGFVLAKVKVSGASKATDKVVKAKVQAGLKSKLESLARKDEALEQSLAIASVGINRHFFKDANNELKAGLELELERAGVRGGSRIVRAMFAEHGVSYAKSILTLAKKISAMPEEVRNQYASALDMTEDSDFGDEEPIGEEVATEDDGMEEIMPASVTAALSYPLRRETQFMRATRSSEAQQILSGSKSLV